MSANFLTEFVLSPHFGLKLMSVLFGMYLAVTLAVVILKAAISFVNINLKPGHASWRKKYPRAWLEARRRLRKFFLKQLRLWLCGLLGFAPIFVFALYWDKILLWLPKGSGIGVIDILFAAACSAVFFVCCVLMLLPFAVCSESFLEEEERFRFTFTEGK